MPAGHTEHDDAASLDQLPASHAMHAVAAVAPVALLAVPAGHDEHDDAPGPLHDPPTHVTQVALLVAPIALLAVPAGHLLQPRLLPKAERLDHEPLGHGKQDSGSVDPAIAPKNPTSQGVHNCVEELSQYPAEQERHSDEDTAPTRPVVKPRRQSWQTGDFSDDHDPTVHREQLFE